MWHTFGPINSHLQCDAAHFDRDTWRNHCSVYALTEMTYRIVFAVRAMNGFSFRFRSHQPCATMFIAQKKEKQNNAIETKKTHTHCVGRTLLSQCNIVVIFWSKTKIY